MGVQTARREKWKHKDVFETYLLMGPSRTISQLSEQTGIPRLTLSSWAKSFRWTARLQARDEKALATIQKENDKLYISEVKNRHQAAYKAVQEKSLDYIEKKGKNFESAKDAAIALDIGIKGERSILGMNDAKLKAGLVKEGFAALLEIVIPGDSHGV